MQREHSLTKSMQREAGRRVWSMARDSEDEHDTDKKPHSLSEPGIDTGFNSVPVLANAG